MARIETVATFEGPSGIARIGDTVWVAEGQVTSLMDPAMKGQELAFQLRSIALPAVPAM